MYITVIIVYNVHLYMYMIKTDEGNKAMESFESIMTHQMYQSAIGLLMKDNCLERQLSLAIITELSAYLCITMCL